MRSGFLWLAIWVVLSAPTIALASPACKDAEVRIQVNVHKVRSPKGTVTLVLYGENPADFLVRGTRVARVRVPAAKGTVTACIAAPGPGTYALTLYHDEDGNGRFNRSFIGWPEEGYGFSRDPSTALGVPRHEDVAFKATAGDTTLDVTMRY